MPTLETIDRRFLSVLSEALIVLLSLPDPPPEIRTFSTLSLIYQLGGTLTDKEARVSVQKAAGAALSRQIESAGRRA
jgi:hypothetical protein